MMIILFVVAVVSAVVVLISGLHDLAKILLILTLAYQIITLYEVYLWRVMRGKALAIGAGVYDTSEIDKKPFRIRNRVTMLLKVLLSIGIMYALNMWLGQVEPPIMFVPMDIFVPFSIATTFGPIFIIDILLNRIYLRKKTLKILNVYISKSIFVVIETFIVAGNVGMLYYYVAFGLARVVFR